MLEDQPSLEIIRTLISVGQNLKMNLVAEGIETQAQLDLLRNYGCRFGQGRYFAGPLSAENAERLIEEGAACPASALTDLQDTLIETAVR